MVAVGTDRWVEVSPSAFEHEQQGLDVVRALLPDETPFRAWSNFEFRDSRGGWHEVDLLLLARDCLYLVELKHYVGTISGDDLVWRRNGRTEDSPLKLARRKAQRLASRLKDELRTWAKEQGVAVDERAVVPFVKEIVFLHHPQGRCALSPSSRLDLYGLPGRESTSGLPGIDELFGRDNNRPSIGANQERILVALLARIGLVDRRDRKAGSWILEPDPIETGDGWQDLRAYHHVVMQDQRRIRVPIFSPDASAAVRAERDSVARHEYRIMSRLSHDGVLKPDDIIETDFGLGLVYPFDESMQRLDLWLAGQSQGVELSVQLALVRQIAEALHYAHGNRVVHRALNPRSIWVRPRPGHGTHADPRPGDEPLPVDPRRVVVQIGDWQSAGSVTPGSGTRTAGVTALAQAGAVPDQAGDDVADPDRMLTEAFRAPEDVWSPDADRVRLDIFALGALTAYLLTGEPPAATANGLKQRLKQQGGIDLAVDLPQVSSELRSLVLKATHPASSHRFGDVAAFLNRLAEAEKASAEPQETADPLEALPGARLDDRFVLDRRLGQGSTAVGLLVRDELHRTEHVLKVALDADAARRLDDEAAVLRRLKHPRVVTLVEGPISVGGRRALVLESAGPQTLADELGRRTRLSLDLLDRYGTDLLDVLVALDKAGVDHRDIKPSNLGIREGRGDRKKHLVLFDFSLTGAAASSTQAGTPPYLDPFFDDVTRPTYDSAAERYAVAVVLFEMATGRPPVYGDGTADPATIPDAATVTRELFDPSLAADLVRFFRKALNRDPRKRHDTAASMRAAWRAMFTSDVTTAPDADNDALAAAATLSTPLRRSGLTARALSAIEPLGVSTVGELLAVELGAMTSQRGVAHATRTQVQARVKQWRARLSPEAPARGPGVESLLDAAQALLSAVPAKSKRDQSRAAMVRLVLGYDGAVDPLATQAELGAHLGSGVTAARAGQVLAELQDLWDPRKGTRELLDDMLHTVQQRLDELGGVATPAELAAALTEWRGGPQDDPRLATGLLRFAIERARWRERAGEDLSSLQLRRRRGVATLVSTDQALFDVAEVLGAQADRLVAGLGDAQREVVPAARVRERLVAALPAHERYAGLSDPVRLAGLATAASTRAVVSATGELHTQALAPAVAIGLTLAGFGGSQGISPKEIRDRVAARFPALALVPERPTLDALVQEASIGLVFDDVTRRYHPIDVTRHTTGLERRRTLHPDLGSAPVAEAGPAGVRLRDSVRSRSFVALGVSPPALPGAVEVVRTVFDADVVDLTALLIASLKEQTASGRPPWDVVRAADAAAAGSRDQRGLAELVRRAWPSVMDRLEQVVAQGGPSPVLVVDAAPLARYGAMPLLGRWTDLAARRDRAVWLLVPQPQGNVGPLLDGAPIPLAAPSQFVPLDAGWIAAARAGATPAVTPQEA